MAVDSATPPQRGDPEEDTVKLSPLNYGELVGRAVSREEKGLNELRRRAEDADVVRKTHFVNVGNLEILASST